jgi:Uma2 family endonuclease
MATATEPARPDRYELVNGEMVEIPPMSLYAEEVANLLNEAFIRHLAANDVGRSRIELGFVLPLTEDAARTRKPDVAFVSYQRWPKNRPLPIDGVGIDVVPDLVVEVVSPTDKAEEVLDKAREYLRGGVPRVWHVYPKNRELHERVGDAIRVYQDAADVTLPDLLPGFRFRLADLLPQPATG